MLSRLGTRYPNGPRSPPASSAPCESGRSWRTSTSTPVTPVGRFSICGVVVGVNTFIELSDRGQGIAGTIRISVAQRDPATFATSVRSASPRARRSCGRRAVEPPVACRFPLAHTGAVNLEFRWYANGLLLRLEKLEPDPISEPRSPQ